MAPSRSCYRPTHGTSESQVAPDDRQARITSGSDVEGRGDAAAQPHVAAMRVAARAAGVMSAGIGGGYLVAWLIGAAARWSAAGVITMKANMALSLLLGGAALILVERDTPSRARAAAASALAAMVLLVGALTLGEHLLALDLGIDQLLATEAPGAAATTSPNRVGLPGSTSLALLGVGLLLAARRRASAAYLGVATCVVVVVPAIGFLYQLGPFYATNVTGIAWLTILALVSLSVGLVLLPRDKSPFAVLWRDDAGGVLVRRLLAPVIVVPLVLGYLRVQGERQGLYTSPTGTGLYAIALILALSALLLISALQLSRHDALRQRASRQLAAERDRLSVTLRSIGDAVIATDAAGRITMLNPVAEGLTGWTDEDALGKPLAEVFHIVNEDTGEEVESPVDRVLREGVIVGLANHTTLIARDGTRCPVADSGAPIRDARGDLRGVVLVFRDYTAHRAAEAERRAGEQALREAARRKDEFLGMLSHELRNPLAPIRNALYILDRAAPAGEQARRAKEVANRQLAHLTRVVDDLLDVTRIGRGKIALRRAEVDLAALTERIAEDHRELMNDRRLELVVQLPAEPVIVDADATRLAQVIGNLLDNARKFTLEGGRISIAVAREDGRAVLRVRDTGSGIAPEVLPTIFEPFTQGQQTLARTEGGLGLGLALVKGLVALHGGEVRAHSAGQGQGTEIVVSIPLATPGTAVTGDPEERPRPLASGSSP